MIVVYTLVPDVNGSCSCSCVTEEDFCVDQCPEGCLDCKEEATEKAPEPLLQVEFNQLFSKYNEANRAIIALQQDNEHFKQRYYDLVKVNEELHMTNKVLARQRDEVYNALKAFEKRIAVLPT